MSSIPAAREFFFSPIVLDDGAWTAREKEFFRSIRLKNGTFKTTHAHRLDDVNEVANTVLPARRPLEMMDVAASSGIATLEWIDCLREAGVEFRMTAGDVCVQAFLLSFGRGAHVLVDATGYPLQFDLFGRVIPYPPRRRLALTSPPLFLGAHLLRWLVPVFFAVSFRRRVTHDSGTAMHRIGVECRATSLVSPRLRACDELTIVEDDLLEPGSFASRFDVIRAANILNRSYFGEGTLRVMIENLRARLRRSGVLIVCRTHDDGSNHGTLFRLGDEGAFEVVRRIGNGSEIESLVATPRGSCMAPPTASGAERAADSVV